MDNKPVEYKAKLLIAQKLLKLKLLVTDPLFDISGSDLLVLKELGEQAKIGIIQSKGRIIKKTQGSNIKIQKEYVKKHFVVFLYIEIEESNDEYLYCYFQDEIEKWPDDDKYFKLSIPVDFANQDYFLGFAYDTSRGNRIQEIFEEENISLQQILEQYTIIDQAYSQWMIFNAFPSVEVLSIISQQVDFSKTSVEQDLLVYISAFLKIEDYENRSGEFTNPISFEFLLSSFAKYSNKTDRIINNENLVSVKSIVSGVHNWYGPFNKYLISEIELVIGDKNTTGIYCLVRDSEGDGVEMYLSKDDEIGFLIRNLISNARTEQEYIIQQLSTKHYA